MMKPPSFWQDKDGGSHVVAQLLGPLAAIYSWVGTRRQQTTIPDVNDGPVVCVGNVSMGGVGKTPFSIMLSEVLSAENLEPAFLTRGYGGRARGPLIVSDTDDFPEIGDEALLLAQHATTCVSADRPEGAKMIFDAQSPDVLIMDDGFQNPSLKKDLSFLMIDAETGFGNGRVFPAGPLREKPAAALERADAIVLVLPERNFPVPSELIDYAGTKPVFHAWLEPPVIATPETDVVAFCGIGRPQKFYGTAAAAGYNIVATREFADHHDYKDQDLSTLKVLAEQHSASLLTTEKDFVRLPLRERRNIEVLPVRMQVDKQQDLKHFLLRAIRKDPAQ